MLTVAKVSIVRFLIFILFFKNGQYVFFGTVCSFRAGIRAERYMCAQCWRTGPPSPTLPLKDGGARRVGMCEREP